jgi:hypothetical protein
MKRKAKTIVAGGLVIFIAVVIVDYMAYRRHQAWYSGIERSLYHGMLLSDLRAYLETDGERHGIRRLREFSEDGQHWFIFENPNYSVITTFITGGFDELLQGGVAVWLDDHTMLTTSTLLSESGLRIGGSWRQILSVTRASRPLREDPQSC